MNKLESLILTWVAAVKAQVLWLLVYWLVSVYFLFKSHITHEKGDGAQGCAGQETAHKDVRAQGCASGAITFA